MRYSRLWFSSFGIQFSSLESKNKAMKKGTIVSKALRMRQNLLIEYPIMVAQRLHLLPSCIVGRWLSYGSIIVNSNEESSNRGDRIIAWRNWFYTNNKSFSNDAAHFSSGIFVEITSQAPRRNWSSGVRCQLFQVLYRLNDTQYEYHHQMNWIAVD